MQLIILFIHVFTALCLITLVLLQHGKGADAGAAFGSGASNTMFGSAGATPFLVKITAILATLFFITSLALDYLASRRPEITIKEPSLQVMAPTPLKDSVPSETDSGDLSE